MRALIVTFCILLPGLSLAAEWTPPDNPDPHTILQEASADTRSGDYETALAKHLWYHDNALKIQPSQSGVRLSFAMSHWLELGEVYPPALSKMREVRDEVDARIRDKEQVRVNFADFHEFIAFNRTLRNDQRTVDTFKWIEGNSSEDATRVFHVAQPALIKLKQYEVCGKYINPEKDIARLGENYESGLKMAKEQFGESHRQYTEKKFLNASTTMVALLVQTDRAKEAKEAAESAKEFIKDKALLKKLDKQMEAALKGKVPNPWP